MKKLDSSVPWSNKWAKYRVIDNSGTLIEFDLEPTLVLPHKTANGSHSMCTHGWHECTFGSRSYIADGYDTTNWQNSLQRRPQMKKLTKDTPWTNNWASHRAVDRNGLLYEFNVEPKYNPLNGNWCIDSRDILQSHDLISNGWEFTLEPQFRVKEVGKVIKPTTPDYHTLPCGTKIPPEGIQAWIKYGTKSDWRTEPKTIVAYANGKYVTLHNGLLTYGDDYSLTDPNVKPEPKGRKMKPVELADKWLRHKDHHLSLKVVGYSDKSVYTRNDALSINEVEYVYEGYSDTPTSELKPFWVEET